MSDPVDLGYDALRVFAGLIVRFDELPLDDLQTWRAVLELLEDRVRAAIAERLFLE